MAMMKLFDFMDWGEVAESLGYRLSHDGASYALRRESDGEEMIFGQSAEEIQALLKQMKGE